MKKIIALVLVLTLALFCFAACKNKNKDNTPTPTPDTPTEKTYSLAFAVDTGVALSRGAYKVTNHALALVIDADNKIVAARFDCAEISPKLEDGALVAETNIQTKVEKGAGYTGMTYPWADEAKAFENWLVGKTAADVAGTEFTNTLIAGCTMTSSMAIFKELIHHHP